MDWFETIKKSKVDLFIERYLQFNADVRGLHGTQKNPLGYLPHHVTSANEDNINNRIKEVIKNYRSILKLGTRGQTIGDANFDRSKPSGYQVKITPEERKQYEEFIQDLKDLVKTESKYDNWKKENEWYGRSSAIRFYVCNGHGVI